MTRLAILLCSVIAFVCADAERFSYRFNSTPLSEALTKISEDHPDARINFIYNELEDYRTSATVSTDDPYTALRQTIGINPVTVIRDGNALYCEAMQHGHFRITGQAMGSDSKPVAAATVMILNPKDSTVVTFGTTKSNGNFSIPCDRTSYILKLTSVGYEPTFKTCHNSEAGIVIMKEHSVRLKELKVEARDAFLYSDRSVFIPSSKQKKASVDAIDLLLHMAIPMIVVNPVSGSVSDNGGTGVSIFINYMKASPEEQKGLLTADVKRVEYFINPPDARFGGEPRVLNFIVQEYEYGGYTRIYAGQCSPWIGVDNHETVFSKFTYKGMTYDLYAGYIYNRLKHQGMESSATYSLLDSQNDEDRVTQDIETGSKVISQSVPVTLRATYNKESTQIQNIIGYSHDGYKGHDNGATRYSNMPEQTYRYHSTGGENSNNVSYSGTFFFWLPKKIAMRITPSFNHSFRYNHDFTDPTVMAPTISNAKETANRYELGVYASKWLNPKHNIALRLRANRNDNHVDYSGSAESTSKFRWCNESLMAIYYYRSDKTTINADCGVNADQNIINGYKVKDVYPFAHLTLNHTPDTKQQIRLYMQYATFSPTMTQKTTSIVKKDDYLYVTGNPDIKNGRVSDVQLNYSFFPSNKLSFSAYGSLNGLFNQMMPTYEHYYNGRALLRSWINNGNSYRWRIGTSAKSSLLNGCLTLSASPSYSITRITGLYDKTLETFSLSAMAIYYLKEFSFMAYYRSRGKTISYFSTSTDHNPDYYSLKVSWVHGNWNVWATFQNIFKSGWKSTSECNRTPLYSMDVTRYDATNHSAVFLNATYTFSYGKKVQNRDEIGEQQKAGSAILK